MDISQTDVYYFSPQKAFGADGGLWVAILSPEAIDRAACVESSAHLEGAHRWVPPFLSLTTALNNSRKDQTLNTPAVATLIMMENQIRWLNSNGGLAWATTRCAKSASILYSWAERSEYAAPFVIDADARSNAVVTIDLDERVQASQILSILRENGIVDAAGYRKLGRQPAARWACSPRWNRLMSWPSPSASTMWSSICDGGLCLTWPTIYAMHIDRSQLIPIE